MTKSKQVAVEHRQSEEDYLDQAVRTRHDLETQVGNSDKKRRIEINAVFFLKTLIEECGGTFIWEGPKQGDQHANIFDGLASQMPAYLSMSLRDKNTHIEDIGPKLRHGFVGARKWLAEWFNATIYCVPQHNEASTQTVLTLNPHYKVECGRTAAEMQTERDYKLAYGQVKASAMRLVASADNKQVNLLIAQIMEKVKSDMREELADRKRLQEERNRTRIEDDAS